MTPLFVIIGLCCLALMLVGLISPKASLFWLTDISKRTRLISFVVYSFGFAVSMTIAVSNDTTIKPETIPADTGVELTDVNKISRWEYSEQIDEMSNALIKTASIPSDNVLQFDFPYNGGSRGILTFRKKGNKLDAYLRISHGQFVPTDMLSYQVAIKCDEGQAQTYTFVGSNDGSPDIIFAQSPEAILKKIKAASTVKIQTTYYNAGLQILQFSPQNLTF